MSLIDHTSYQIRIIFRIRLCHEKWSVFSPQATIDTDIAVTSDAAINFFTNLLFIFFLLFSLYDSFFIHLNFLGQQVPFKFVMLTNDGFKKFFFTFIISVKGSGSHSHGFHNSPQGSVFRSQPAGRLR